MPKNFNISQSLYTSIMTTNFKSLRFLQIAKELFEEIRRFDSFFNDVEIEAKAYIWALTSHKANNIGSFALLLNLFDSDLDFTIGVTNNERTKVINRLNEKLEFRGERYATNTTTRHLFCTKIQKVDIDVNVMILEDYIRLNQYISNAQINLDINSRIIHVGRKFQLKSQERRKEYDEFKLEIYREIAPEFLWIPDYRIRQMLASKKLV